MIYPMAFNSNSDFPIWLADTSTILSTFGSVKASIGSLRYGVLEVRHGPASAELSEDSRLYLSAHCDKVRFSGGLKFLTAFDSVRLIRTRSIGFIFVVFLALTFSHLPPEFVRVVFVVRQIFKDVVAFSSDDS